ncbi:MAG: helix-turn-helix domain-containing protein, partial [Thermoplasmatota archaeon]
MARPPRSRPRLRRGGARPALPGGVAALLAGGGPAVALALHLVLLRRDDLLALEARRRVYQNVEEFPGLHLSEVARQCGLETNHAKYHLDALEKHGLVSSRMEGALQV